MPAHFAQLRNYLGLLDMRVGLLVNFHGYPNVEIRRVYVKDRASEGIVENVATGDIAPILNADGLRPYAKPRAVWILNADGLRPYATLGK